MAKRASGRGSNPRDHLRNPQQQTTPEVARATERAPTRSFQRVLRQVDHTPDGVGGGAMQRPMALPSVGKVDPEKSLKAPGHAYTTSREPLGSRSRMLLDQQASKEQTLDQRLCKARPEPRKSGGKGRSFVPWCK